MSDCIRVFVGMQREQWLPFKVLKYSIERFSSSDVDIVALNQSQWTYSEPDRPECRQRTPFSFQRFLIPEICKFNGKAIYLDSDMLVFADIASLWSKPLGDADLLAGIRSEGEVDLSVMLMDCSRFRVSLQGILSLMNRGKLSYEALMSASLANKLDLSLSEDWNSLDRYQLGVNLIHYTDMNRQPWLNITHPYGDIWLESLKGAIEHGDLTMTNILDCIKRGDVRPSLIMQLDGEDMATCFEADSEFVPPHVSMGLY